VAKSWQEQRQGGASPRIQRGARQNRILKKERYPLGEESAGKISARRTKDASESEEGKGGELSKSPIMKRNLLRNFTVNSKLGIPRHLEKKEESSRGTGVRK